MQVHPVLVARRISIDAGPGAGWKLGIAHDGVSITTVRLMSQLAKRLSGSDGGLGSRLPRPQHP
jgi:hypothetical protein